MSLGPLGGVTGSAAGAPLSQTKGSETERSLQDASGAERATGMADKADTASGVGETQQDQETSDRDADGRRLWEVDQRPETTESDDDEQPRQSKDASGSSGTRLDLTG